MSQNIDMGNHIWRNMGATGKRKENEFIYTRNDGNGLLTYEQRLFYDNNGYLVIPNLVSDYLLEKLRQRFLDLCDGKVPRGSITLMKDISVVKKNPNVKGEALYYKAQDILYDDVFQEYFLIDKLLDVVACITGPDILGMHSMLINKPPDTGTLSSRHPLHQDLYYFPFRPADHIVAAWTAMENVDESNGCLFVLPGSHKGMLHKHQYPDWEGGVNKAFHGIAGMDQHPKTYLPMAKGETVFFHPLLMHGSGYNKTKGYRKAISCHFASADCHYIDVEGTVQEPIAKEILGMAEKRGLNLSIQELWHLRSRPLRGNSPSLKSAL